MATTPGGMPEQSGQPASGGQQVSGFGRVIGALTSPKETFADIARKPTVLLPLVLLTVFSIAFAYTMNQRIDWQDYIRQQIDKSPRADQMSPEQKQQAAATQAKFSAPFAYIIGGIGPLVGTLLMGLIYWGAFNMFAGAGASFKQSWGVAAHSSLVGLISSPLGILVMWMKRYGEVTPENMLASNVGAFLSSDSPAWMRSVGGSLDIFWFWQMFLLAVGFAAINPKKVSTGKALGIIIGIWVVWVLCKAGLAAAFS